MWKLLGWLPNQVQFEYLHCYGLRKHCLQNNQDLKIFEAAGSFLRSQRRGQLGPTSLGSFNSQQGQEAETNHVCFPGAAHPHCFLSPLLPLFKKCICLYFACLWLCWVFISVHRLPLVAVYRLLISVASHVKYGL